MYTNCDKVFEYGFVSVLILCAIIVIVLLALGIMGIIPWKAGCP